MDLPSPQAASGQLGGAAVGDGAPSRAERLGYPTTVAATMPTCAPVGTIEAKPHGVWPGRTR